MGSLEISTVLWTLDITELMNLRKSVTYVSPRGMRSLEIIGDGVRLVESRYGVATVLSAKPNTETCAWESELWVFETFTNNLDSLRLATEILIVTEPPFRTRDICQKFTGSTSESTVQRRYGPALMVFDAFLNFTNEQRSNFMARQPYHDFRRRHGIT